MLWRVNVHLVAFRALNSLMRVGSRAGPLGCHVEGCDYGVIAAIQRKRAVWKALIKVLPEKAGFSTPRNCPKTGNSAPLEMTELS